ncbi:MAG: ABC transporter ATP-binding protein [Clostridia bacterium]|nr:ABC transporter ATP-binding protein [Clostridia bacterium]
MKNIIEVRNVTKEYKKGHHKALNNVSLSIRENELFGLLGINGAGKTTLINIITGLIKKTSGKVFVAGLNVDKNRDMRKIRSMINISPQETSVATNLTVQENLKFFEALYGVKDNKETDEIIKRFKLRRFLK